MLGICYGLQLMAHELGGEVVPSAKREYGPASVQITSEDGLFRGIDREQPVWMSHGDTILRPPEGFVPTAAERLERVRRVGRCGARPVRHPVPPRGGPYPARQGDPAQLRGRHRRGRADLDAGLLRRDDRGRHRAAGRDPGRAICALSGGVDSAVAAALVHRAIGDQLTCIYVDHGLMRKRESELLRTTFAEHLGMKLVMVDARDRFLRRLAGVEDPEEKRRIIGDEFIRVFEEEAQRLGEIDFLVQGTLYPDVIESTTAETKAAAKIKTHHNVGGLPADLRFSLVEPLRYLFKDEVRRVGAELGLPEAIVLRQPFPGAGPGDPDHRRGDRRAAGHPARGGLDRDRRDQGRRAVSVPVAVVRHPDPGAQRGRHGRRADLRQRGGHPRGDIRRRDDGGLGAAAVRDPGHDQQSRIVNEVPGVNRVVYDISSKPPATIEWE